MMFCGTKHCVAIKEQSGEVHMWGEHLMEPGQTKETIIWKPRLIFLPQRVE